MLQPDLWSCLLTRSAPGRRRLALDAKAAAEAVQRKLARLTPRLADVTQQTLALKQQAEEALQQMPGGQTIRITGSINQLG